VTTRPDIKRELQYQEKCKVPAYYIYALNFEEMPFTISRLKISLRILWANALVGRFFKVLLLYYTELKHCTFSNILNSAGKFQLGYIQAMHVTARVNFTGTRNGIFYSTHAVELCEISACMLTSS
jgi:hypothetical protein